MNSFDLVVADEIIPPVEKLLEQFFETGKILIKSNSSGVIDAIEALRLKRHEQNFRKLLSYTDNSNELRDFISSSSSKQKDFLVQVLIKTANLENDVQIFIMSKIIQNLKNNDKLNYYESSLFTNINSLTFEDFEIFYELYSTKYLDNALYVATFETKNIHFYTSMDKFISIGIIKEVNTFWKERMIEKDGKYQIYFETMEYSDIFFEYLKEYFEASK